MDSKKRLKPVSDNLSISCNEFNAKVCNFEGEYYFDLNKQHWVRLGIVQTITPLRYCGASIPLVVELIEVNLMQDQKSVDVYHFPWYHTGCAYHGHCETKPQSSVDTSGTGDRDISRLLNFKDEISQILKSQELPKTLRENLIVRALTSGTLNK